MKRDELILKGKEWLTSDMENPIEFSGRFNYVVDLLLKLSEEYPKLSQRLNEIDTKADKVIERNKQLVQDIQNMNKVAVSKDELNGYFEELYDALKQ